MQMHTSSITDLVISEKLKTKLVRRDQNNVIKLALIILTEVGFHVVPFK